MSHNQVLLTNQLLEYNPYRTPAFGLTDKRQSTIKQTLYEELCINPIVSNLYYVLINFCYLACTSVVPVNAH